MIAFLRGLLLRKDVNSCIVDIHGVGMEIFIPRSTFEALGDTGSEFTIWTHLHVREDALILFGFATEVEKDLFRLLLSVSGIGPKVALSVLSGYKVDDIYHFIAEGNDDALSRIPGLGKKTVQRLILDLQEKAQRHLQQAGLEYTKIGPARVQVEEAIMALVSLGHSRIEAEATIQQAVAKCGDSATVEELVRTALLQ
jgi:Holliday junction DNA helicase RuvA